MKQSHTFTKRTHALQQRQQVGDYDSTQIHWSDGYANLPPVRPCGRVGLSWSGGVPPYILQGRWWPQTDSYTADSAREWIIAMNMQNTTYDWLATVPANSTVWIDAFDSTSSQTSTLIFQVNYTSTAGETDSKWCMSQYPAAAAASPGVQVDLQQAAAFITSSTSSNGASPTTISSTSPYTLAQARNGTGSSSGATQSLAEKQYGDRSGVIAGLSISVGVLSLAFLILLFFHIRLMRRVRRSDRGQTTIGKWSKQHFDNDAQESKDAEKPWESFTVTKPQAASSSLSSRKERTPHAFSGTSFFSTQSGTSRLSSFFEHRSASRSGQNNNSEQRDMRQSSSSTVNPFEDYSEIASTSSHRTTTTTLDDTSSSASRSKRYSTAETAISESNTIQSESGRSHVSAAPSEKASTVGDASAVSDEYYHRKKATTISPTGTSRSAMQKFLTPGSNGA